MFKPPSDQFNIPASETENFITLALPREFVIPWQKQGCTHLHFDVVRLALTFHDSFFWTELFIKDLSRLKCQL